MVVVVGGRSSASSSSLLSSIATNFKLLATKNPNPKIGASYTGLTKFRKN